MVLTDAQQISWDGRLFIDGRRTEGTSGASMAHINPTTGKVLGTFVAASREDGDRAVTAARNAYPAWRAVAPGVRRDILLRAAQLIRERAELIAAMASHETGAVYNPLAPARSAEQLVYYAGWIDKLEGGTTPVGPSAFNYWVHEPYGVVLALTSWNGPLTSALMKLAPALAAGNCVVLKAPELGPFVTLLLADLFAEAGLPAGVLNVVTGGPALGASLVADPRIGKISFTGGLPTARHIMRDAAENATPVVMELGGKSANLVFADADLDRAAGMAVMMGCVVHAGQGCLFPTRLLVQDSVYDAVVERVLANVAKARIGNPFTPGVASGPLINEAALARVLGAIEQAKSEGSGRLLHGGHRLGGDLADGYFLAPTIFGDVDNGSALAKKEIFGPVLSIIRFTDEDDAVAKANDTDYGLAGYVHTGNLDRAHRVASRLEAGYIGINGFPPMPVQAAFGGYKQSGFGREGGRLGIEEFMRVKNVYVSF